MCGGEQQRDDAADDDRDRAGVDAERLVRVTREQPPDNRRLVFAVLTPEGEEACLGTTARVYRAALADEFTSLLNDRDLADLRRIGRKLLEGHGRWDVKRFAPSEE